MSNDFEDYYDCNENCDCEQDKDNFIECGTRKIRLSCTPHCCCDSTGVAGATGATGALILGKLGGYSFPFFFSFLSLFLLCNRGVTST